jgi:hypothetical protein
MVPEEATKLWKWYETGGFQKIAAWLHQRDVTAFNPAAAPPVTEWKMNMVEHGLSVAESFLVEMMQKKAGPFNPGIVAGPFHKLCDALAAGYLPAGTKIPQAALLHAFKEAGWVDVGRLASAELPTKKHTFTTPEMVTRYSKSDLRRMVEGGSATEGKVINLR